MIAAAHADLFNSDMAHTPGMRAAAWPPTSHPCRPGRGVSDPSKPERRNASRSVSGRCEGKCKEIVRVLSEGVALWGRLTRQIYGVAGR